MTLGKFVNFSKFEFVFVCMEIPVILYFGLCVLHEKIQVKHLACSLAFRSPRTVLAIIIIT